MHKNSLPNDVWLAARMLWENTIDISDRDLVKQLTKLFPDDAPKSGGTISKRRTKESWVKNNLINQSETTPKLESKQESKPPKRAKNRNQKPPEKTLIPSKVNKAQKVESDVILESVNDKISEVAESIVMDAKARAKIIQKYRRRWAKLGEHFDQALDAGASLQDKVENAEIAALNKSSGEDSDSNLADDAANEVQKALVLSDALTTSVERLTRALKVLSEVELPLCGVTPDDFTQSDQDRRLDAISQLGNIDQEEREARQRLLPDLYKRLSEIQEVEASPDFGQSNDFSGEDIEDAEEIDYTDVD